MWQVLTTLHALPLVPPFGHMCICVCVCLHVPQALAKDATLLHGAQHGSKPRLLASIPEVLSMFDFRNSGIWVGLGVHPGAMHGKVSVKPIHAASMLLSARLWIPCLP